MRLKRIYLCTGKDMFHCCKKNTRLLPILLLVSILAHFGCANLIDDIMQFFDSNKVIADFGNNFFWGLGTAPTHVEDVSLCFYSIWFWHLF